MLATVALTAVALAATIASLVAHVGRPYPGFFFSPDYRVLPVERAARDAGLRAGDRIVSAAGRSPLSLLDVVRAADGRPVRYELERAGRRLAVDLAPAPYTLALAIDRFGGFVAVSLVMLAVGLAVFAQNPAGAPNRRFLVYMCLWAVSNVAVPEATLGPTKHAAVLVGLVPPLLVVHGWIVFLTYPVNPAREAWLARHRVIPRLYAAGAAVAVAITVTFAVLYGAAPERLVGGWFLGASQAFQVALAVVSFPIKIGALLDTRRRAASRSSTSRRSCSCSASASAWARGSCSCCCPSSSTRRWTRSGARAGAALPAGDRVRDRALPLPSTSARRR